MTFEDARRTMVESQLRPNRVTDERVLSAMGSVPRERFLPDGLRPIAYVDEDLEFVEYFVPAECRTVWVNPELVCAWLPTGKNIDGGEPSRSIGAHSSAETVNPEGV